VFGELWIDQEEALRAGLETAPHDLTPRLTEFIENGYTIFSRAVSEEAIDRVAADLQRIDEHGDRYILKKAGVYLDPVGHGPLDVGDRVIDLYGASAAAREAIFRPDIVRFLNLIFGEPPIAMQSLNFEYGSQQAIHQDTAYVVSSKPLGLAATWLALEDVEEGAGELIYYRGSHRFEHFLFNGQEKSWSQQRDGTERHKEFLTQLHTQAKQRAATLDRFLAKKGDILVWHADLAHGGAPITRPGRTRRSLVTHFCPFSVKPGYRTRVGEYYHELPGPPVSYFTSRHYDLRNIAQDGHASIFYDGGITKMRAANVQQ
jgi:phytanoyl-CoA hydroxylase